MIEVFKTNVQDKHQAEMLLEKIHATFYPCSANFDLEDCDNILRVKYTGNSLQSSELIDLLQGNGFYAEILSEDLPVFYSDTIIVT